MGTLNFFMFKSHFKFVDGSFLGEFVNGTMFRFGNSFWVLVCTVVFNLFGFIIKYISRFQADDDGLKIDSNCGGVHSQQDDQIVSNSSPNSESYGFSEKESSESSYGFQFRRFNDSNKSIAETENSVFMESGSTASTSKYQFVSGKDVSGFMEGPQTMSFTVQELIMDPNEGLIGDGKNFDNGVSMDKKFRERNLEENVQQFYDGSKHTSFGNDQFIDFGLSTSKHCEKIISEAEAVNQEKAEDPVTSLCTDEALEEQEQVTSAEHELSDNKEMVDSHDNFSEKQSLFRVVQLLPETQFLPSDSKPESDSSSDGFLISPHKVDSVSNEFFSDRHVNEGLESDTPLPIYERKTEFIEEIPSLQEISTWDSGISDGLAFASRDESEDTDDEYIELKPHVENSSELDKETLSWKDYSKVEDLHELESAHSEAVEPMDGLGKSEEHSSVKKSWFSDSDDEDESDILLEHQDLIEQMKMELKNARTRGLPTILEESETPKMVEDLKPLKIDEKFEHRDHMEEIQKFYKSYTEKMRKLDILNYQTLHAISFLQLKDPIQLTSGKKNSVQTIKSLPWPKFWPCKLQRVYADPTLKSITELHRNLEMVYVGQACVSWEILHWQYGKAKELLEFDSQGNHSYNQVAVEFQQFEVLVQRFIEDESFQGTRVQNYVQNRCSFSSLIQVPIVKDDCLKDKGRREEEKDAISIGMLAKIIGESLQIFWEFLHADKDHASVFAKGPRGAMVELQDPADLELLMDIKTNLQKKEKRLKEILRTGNCIVKKFQKHRGGRLDYALLVSQVELGLVSRVLSLSRLTTDQLVWCQKKLENINFVNRKIYVESSFLLFPC